MKISDHAAKREAVIEVKHLKKSFGGHAVLKDISFKLYKGETLALLGRSGQGKSVTIKCVAGLIDQDQGSITVSGKEIIKLNETALKSIRRTMGFLFQGGALYDSMSVRDNLSFPLTRVFNIRSAKEITTRINDLLEEMDLIDVIDKMPGELSGGTLKRIALARSLIGNPEIMLYDEPTTGLDPITAREISKLIVDMQQRHKTSSIIITHDMDCAEMTADRVLVLNDGEFIEEGTFREVQQSRNEMVRSFFK